MFDPREHGASCADCWLATRRAGGPVASETGTSNIAIVGEAPGADEVECHRPFVGRSGQELMTALAALGLRRSDVTLINTLLCRPPGNELAKLEYSLNAENRRRKKLNRELADGEEPFAILPHPVKCCRARLWRELAAYPNILTLGDTAFHAVTGLEHSITKMRGSCLEGWFSPTEGYVSSDEGELGRPLDSSPVKILPTFHPALVLRQRKWTGVFRGDIGRAVRWFRGVRNWVDPVVVIRPTIPELRAFLASSPWFAWDLETNGKEPLVAQIRCFGVGTPRKVMVVPLLSTDGRTKFYTSDDEKIIRHELASFLANRNIMKAGWNSINYDRCVAEQQLGVTPRKHFDGILAHHCVEAEMPHSLGFAGTTLTDVVAWKQDSEDVLTCSDEILHERNWKDVCVTAHLVAPLEQALQFKAQLHVCKMDHKVQDICAGLHRTGMLVDPVARDAHGKRLLQEIIHNRKIIRDVLGKPQFNPSSIPQISDLLYETWGLPPVKLSEKTGAPSTDDDALREYRVNYNLTGEQKGVIEALRRVRKAVKYRGTNILKLVRKGEHVPEDEFSEDAEETKEEREYRRKKDLKKEGILLADGRVHSKFSIHVASTGRLASSDPNVQNWDRELRDMFIATPGNVIVGADLDQVEVRYAAAHWRMQHMLEVFREGRDPHYETMLAVFGKAAEAALAKAKAWAAQTGKKYKEEPAFQKMRTFGKMFRFASQYGAKDKTIHRIVSSVEDNKGNLVYADVSLAECANRRKLLLEADPEYETGWADEIATWRKQGYLQERIWGRRRYFLNGEPTSDDEEAYNEIRNFPVQSACASICHEAAIDLVQAIPFEKWGPGTGLICQVHDALYVECPEKEAKWVAGVMTECMTRKYPGLDVVFKAEAHVGRRWSDL